MKVPHNFSYDGAAAPEHGLGHVVFKLITDRTIDTASRQRLRVSVHTPEIGG